MRVIGLDYGTKTVGVAISDELLITAQPLLTIERERANKLRKTVAKIEEIISEYNVEEIVLGYPKNMNNTLGERAAATDEFREMLERRTGLPVILVDERLTTVSAHRILSEGNVRGRKRRQKVDGLSAVLILQGYLDFLGEAEKQN